MTRSFGRVLVAVAVAAAGCEDTQVPTTPTPGTPTFVTDTFNGTLSVNGAATFTFSVGSAGNVTATVSSLSPDSSSTVGVSLGTWNGSSCQEVLANDAAVQGSQIVGTASAATDVCVRIRDVGKLAEAQTFTLTVAHPE